MICAVIAPVVQWLLASEEPAIRRLARRDLLGEPVRAAAMEGPRVRALLDGLDDHTVHPYRKWHGAHWRLVELVELEATDDERVPAAVNHVLAWVTSDRHRASIRTVDGLPRVHASMEGNALIVCCALGMQEDPRVKRMAEDLIAWQWPDGGWNCDPRATGRRSSFHESLIPMHGLFAYGAVEAAQRAAELLLDHRLFRRTDNGEPIHPEWLRLHHPPRWRYDILHALTVLTQMGRVGDPRAGDALAILKEKRLKNGRWRGKEMITLNALRVLAALSDVPEDDRQQRDEPEVAHGDARQCRRPAALGAA
jgi:hypothetical protein